MTTNPLCRVFEKSSIVLLVFQLVGCGTIFYPERRGQRAGHLDVGVVLLDGLGLLFFLIPGVIAFAVDFSNGTIYLPGGSLRANVRQIKFDPKHASLAQIEKIIKDETGRTILLTQENIQVRHLNSKEDLMASLTKSSFDIQAGRLALTQVKGGS